MIRETSKEIYNKILKSGLLPKKRQQIYEIIFLYGPMTGSQVAEMYKANYPSNNHSESIRNRITELTQQGVVKGVKTGACPITTNTVLWFDVTSKLPVKLQKKATKKEKKDEIVKLISDFGKAIGKSNITADDLFKLLDIKTKVLDL